MTTASPASQIIGHQTPCPSVHGPASGFCGLTAGIPLLDVYINIVS